MNKNKRQDCLAEPGRAMQLAEAGDSARRCMDCDTPIPADRLQAVPDATRCIDCQRDIERSAQWDWGMAE